MQIKRLIASILFKSITSSVSEKIVLKFIRIILYIEFFFYFFLTVKLYVRHHFISHLQYPDLSGAPCRPRTRQAWACGLRWHVLPRAGVVEPGPCHRLKPLSLVFRCTPAAKTVWHPGTFLAANPVARIAEKSISRFFFFVTSLSSVLPFERLRDRFRKFVHDIGRMFMRLTKI